MDNHANRFKRDKIPHADLDRRGLDLTIPFYFSARKDHQNLRVGDYVSIRGLPSSDKFQILDVSPRSGTVRVKSVDRSWERVIPWGDVEPYKSSLKSKNNVQLVGDWLFRGSRVYMLSEPERMLNTVKINWDEGTSDLKDEAGRVFRGVPWDNLEFWDPIEFHFPDDN